MTEEDLNKMSINELSDLLVITVNELTLLHKYHDHKNMDDKRKEAELIQGVIIAKRAAETPLK